MKEDGGSLFHFASKCVALGFAIAGRSSHRRSKTGRYWWGSSINSLIGRRYLEVIASSLVSNLSSSGRVIILIVRIDNRRRLILLLL